MPAFYFQHYKSRNINFSNWGKVDVIFVQGQITQNVSPINRESKAGKGENPRFFSGKNGYTNSSSKQNNRNNL
ncbi:hypothetical protein ACTHQ8_01015 [Lysinibacillus odysseyi]